jgi:hypothetical protein
MLNTSFGNNIFSALQFILLENCSHFVSEQQNYCKATVNETTPYPATASKQKTAQ